MLINIKTIKINGFNISVVQYLKVARYQVTQL